MQMFLKCFKILEKLFADQHVKDLSVSQSHKGLEVHVQSQQTIFISKTFSSGQKACPEYIYRSIAQCVCLVVTKVQFPSYDISLKYLTFLCTKRQTFYILYFCTQHYVNSSNILLLFPFVLFQPKSQGFRSSGKKKV